MKRFEARKETLAKWEEVYRRAEEALKAEEVVHSAKEAEIVSRAIGEVGFPVMIDPINLQEIAKIIETRKGDIMLTEAVLNEHQKIRDSGITVFLNEKRGEFEKLLTEMGCMVTTLDISCDSKKEPLIMVKNRGWGEDCLPKDKRVQVSTN